MKSTPSPLKRVSRKSMLLLLAGIITGSIGTLMLLTSHAATPTASFQAESGTLSANALTVSDTAASNGSAVKFTAGQTGTSAWPDATNTGYAPTGVTLHTCSTSVGTSGTYDSCLFNGDVVISGACNGSLTISRSQINGQVLVQGPGGYEYTPGNIGPNAACNDHAVVISDTTINCGCQSGSSSQFPASSTPVIVGGLNFTLLRDNIYNGGHGVAPDEFVTVQDSYIHGLGGNTDAHKDGFFISDGDHMTFRHNQIDCNDGPLAGCTSAIGILSDFSDSTYITFDNNLLNTIGSYCFYGSGGPQKTYHTSHSSFINNHFGRKYYTGCGFYGPVTYWDTSATGNVWSGNVWDDTGATVPAAY